MKKNKNYFLLIAACSFLFGAIFFVSKVSAAGKECDLCTDEPTHGCEQGLVCIPIKNASGTVLRSICGPASGELRCSTSGAVSMPAPVDAQPNAVVQNPIINTTGAPEVNDNASGTKTNGKSCTKNNECKSGFCGESGSGSLVCMGVRNEGDSCSITGQAMACRDGLMCQGDTFICVVDDRATNLSSTGSTSTNTLGTTISAPGLCSAVGAGYACVKTSDVNNATSACVSGKCSGGNDIKCCNSANFKSAGIKTYPELTGSGSGGTKCNPNDNTQFCNPLSFSTVEGFLANFLTTLQRIIAVIALIAIVIGAIMYITSGGGKQVETAKKTISSALIGMVIAIAAPSFLKEISVLLGWTPNDAAVAGALTLTQIAMNVLNFLLSILGVIALVMLVISGVMYSTSAMDSKQVETAKNMAKYAIMGVIVAMSSMIILQQIARFFAS